MVCKNCGAILEDNVKFCAHCGAMAVRTGNVQNEQATENQTSQAAESQTSQMASNQAAQTTGNFSAPLQSGGDSGKKKKPTVKIAVVAAVLVVVLVVIAAATPVFGNVVRRTFSSPVSYYRYVEKNSWGDITSLAAVCYSSVREALTRVNGGRTEGSMELEISEKVQKLLKSYTGEKFDWLSTVGLTFSANIKNKVISGELGTALGKTKIISANMMMDAENEMFYLQLPEVNEKYIGIEIDNPFALPLDRSEDIFQLAEAILNALPKDKDVENILNRYIGIALDCVKDVKETKGTLSAGDVSEKCTIETVTIDEDLLRDMLQAVCSDAKKDKELGNIIRAVAGLIEAEGGYIDADDVYDEFLDLLDELEEAADDIRLEDEIEMNVYISSSGKIVGREIEYVKKYTWNDNPASYTYYFAYKMPTDGSKFGREIAATVTDRYMGGGYDWWSGTYKDYYEIIAEEGVEITGSGKVSSGRLTGDFEVVVLDNRRSKDKNADYTGYNDDVNIEFSVEKLDLTSLLKNSVSGSVVLPLGQFSEYESAFALFDDYSVRLSFDMKKKSSQITFSLLEDEDVLGTLRMSFEVAGEKKTSIPSSKNVVLIEDLDDAETWLKGVKWNTVLESLENANLPSAWRKELKEALKYYTENVDDLVDILEDIFDGI